MADQYRPVDVDKCDSGKFVCSNIIELLTYWTWSMWYDTIDLIIVLLTLLIHVTVLQHYSKVMLL